MEFKSSISDQNIFFTYVCLVNDVKPSASDHDTDMNTIEIGERLSKPSVQGLNSAMQLDRDPIQVERSKAVHELVESNINENKTLTVKTDDGNEDCDSKETDPTGNVNPNILQLTKMKWLTENQDGSDSSSPYMSSNSSTSICSRESEEFLDSGTSYGDKCLSTILRLDREHNLFGLSNIAIVGKKTSRRIRKEDDRPAFHQTAIIQVCCGSNCCKYKTKSDLPYSLKCRRCTPDPCFPPCISPCGPPAPCELPTPCPSVCSSCPRGKCCCQGPFRPSKCFIDCSSGFGLKVSYRHKTKYEPSPIELTPRSSCILQKPMCARLCPHTPRCLPPSSCSPYLMPCYWPSRAGAPCSHPSRCFHTPPCRAPRPKKLPVCCLNPEQMCPTTGPCVKGKNDSCPNQLCLGRIPAFREAIQKKYNEKNSEN